jgi:hypothetical protein
VKRSRRRRNYHLWAYVFGQLGSAVVVGVAFIVIAVAIWVHSIKTPASQIKWGFTYSHLAARQLKLDPNKAYVAALDELKPQTLRLVAYWSEIESAPGKYNFSYLDFQVAEAAKRHIPYVIVVGMRVPRYPECYAPSWSKKLDSEAAQDRLLEYTSRVVRRYQDQPGLTSWQLENEPYLGSFGVCPKLNEAHLKQEVASLKTETNLPIMMTDSGEISFWYKASRFPDVFGTTMYRVVINKKTNKVFHHFIPAWAYTLRAGIVRAIHPNVKKVVVAELQGEPWSNAPLIEKDQAYFRETMDHKQFDENLRFAQDAGLSEVYAWGVEWWYFEKLHGDSYYWQKAASTFSSAK